MNILAADALRQCTSCQMCAAVCPTDAIRIELNIDGFYRPVLQESKCTNCGLCTSVCYRFDTNLRKTIDFDLQRFPLYASYSKNEEVVQSTTSGGVADELARKLIELGYHVIGVTFDKVSNRAINTVAQTEEQTIRFRGSKYIQSYTFDSFRQLVKQCRTQKFAIFGLPCHIYAIHRFLERIHQRNNHLLIDLYCHGCPSMYVWDKLKYDIQQKCKIKAFDDVSFRSKLRGWGTFTLEVKSKGRTVYNSTPLHNEFFDLFFSNQVLNDSCMDCQLRGTLAYTDIRLGDFWGKTYRKNTRGISGVSLVTDSAIALWEKMTDCVDYETKDYSEFLPYQSWGHSYKINQKLRDELLGLLRSPNTSLAECEKSLEDRRSKINKTKRIIQQLFYYLPIKFSVLIRQ